jgi:hypothetical protein
MVGKPMLQEDCNREGQNQKGRRASISPIHQSQNTLLPLRKPSVPTRIERDMRRLIGLLNVYQHTCLWLSPTNMEHSK